jgi:hypothetical protein
MWVGIAMLGLIAIPLVWLLCELYLYPANNTPPAIAVLGGFLTISLLPLSILLFVRLKRGMLLLDKIGFEETVFFGRKRYLWKEVGEFCVRTGAKGTEYIEFEITVPFRPDFEALDAMARGRYRSLGKYGGFDLDQTALLMNVWRRMALSGTGERRSVRFDA